MTMQTLNIGTLIVRTPNIRGGRPCIPGTGVTIQRIVGWYKVGLSPEEIADTVGHLTLAQVHAALAYYHANRQEIESVIAADKNEAARFAQQQPSNCTAGDNVYNLSENSPLTHPKRAPA